MSPTEADHIIARVEETKAIKRRIWQAVMTGTEDHLQRDKRRGRELGLDVDAIEAEARKADAS